MYVFYVYCTYICYCVLVFACACVSECLCVHMFLCMHLYFVYMCLFMCMFMCFCMHEFTYVYLSICLHESICVYVCIFVYMRVYIYTHLCLYICVCICILMCLYVCVFDYVDVLYLCLYVHVYVFEIPYVFLDVCACVHTGIRRIIISKHNQIAISYSNEIILFVFCSINVDMKIKSILCLKHLREFKLFISGPLYLFIFTFLTSQIVRYWCRVRGSFIFEWHQRVCWKRKYNIVVPKTVEKGRFLFAFGYFFARVKLQH